MVPNDSPYPKTWGLKKIRFLACLEAELLQEELRHLSRPFVVDFTDLADVGILPPNVFCVRLYQISLEHTLKRQNGRLCNPPPPCKPHKYTVRSDWSSDMVGRDILHLTTLGLEWNLFSIETKSAVQ